MKKISFLFFIAVMSMVFSAVSFAWYGPICYPDRIAHVSLTLQSIVGESPGDIKVSFDNNAGIVELEAVKPSKNVPGAHEIILKRSAESESGIVGVIATSPRSSVGYKFELEFRKSATECTGAILKVSATGDRYSETVAKPKAAVRSPKPVKAEKKIIVPAGVEEAVPSDSTQVEKPASLESGTKAPVAPAQAVTVPVAEPVKETTPSAEKGVQATPAQIPSSEPAHQAAPSIEEKESSPLSPVPSENVPEETQGNDTSAQI